MHFRLNLHSEKPRETNPASGQKHRASFPLKFKKFSCSAKVSEIHQKGRSPLWYSWAALEKNSIILSCRQTTYMLLILKYIGVLLVSQSI